jgi:signal transduction histidine kinase
VRLLTIDRRYAIPVTLALLLCAVFFVVAEARRNELRQTAAQVWEATDRLRMLTNLRALVTDAETGQRGFLLTGDESYLVPLEEAKVALPQALADLRASYAPDDAESLAQMDRLAELMAVKLGEVDATITLRTTRGQSSAMRVVNTEVGERTMQDFRAQIDAVRNRERALVEGAMRAWNRENRVNTAVLGAGTLMNMFLVLLAAHFVTRDVRRRREHTERLETEVSARTKELMELSTHLQRVSEAEKAALARELHDELGALLVAVKMDLTQLQRHLPMTMPDVGARWQRIQTALSEGIDLKRRVVEQLRPTLLDNMGLVAALKWQLQETCSRSNLKCLERFPEEEPEIDGDTAIAVFRIVQEALTNIVKHAKATTTEVTLDVRGGYLVVTVEDDGIGLSLDAATSGGVHGVTSMRHRVRTLGGEFVVGAGTGGVGTRISIMIPLAGTVA